MTEPSWFHADASGAGTAHYQGCRSRFVSRPVPPQSGHSVSPRVPRSHQRRRMSTPVPKQRRHAVPGGGVGAFCRTPVSSAHVPPRRSPIGLILDGSPFGAARIGAVGALGLDPSVTPLDDQAAAEGEYVALMRPFFGFPGLQERLG